MRSTMSMSKQTMDDLGLKESSIMVFSIMVCVWNGVNMHLFGHLDARGFQGERAAIVLSLMGAFIVIGKPVLGIFADVYGAKSAVLVSLFAQTAGVAVFWLGGDYASLMLGAVAYGFGLSGMAPLQSMAICTFMFFSNWSISAYDLRCTISTGISIFSAR